MINKMNLTAAIGIVAVCICVNACQENPTGTNKREAKRGVGLDETPVPDEALSYTVDDYKKLFAEEIKVSPALAKAAASPQGFLDFTEMVTVHNSINQYVPDWNNISSAELDKIQTEFGLSRKELAVKADVILGIYVAKKRYKLYKAMVDYMKANNRKPLLKSAYDYPYDLSSDEIWVLVMNPNNVLATQRASERALSFTVEAFGRQGWLDKPDAHRHAMWNSLIASYNAPGYQFKSDCIGFAKKFTDAHETGNGANPNNTLDQPMDYHNNAGGRTFFNGKAVNRGKLNWWGYNSRWVQVPDDATTKTGVKILTDEAFQYTATSQLSSLGAKLVFVQN